MLTTCVFLKDVANLKHRETIRVFSEHHITDTAHKAFFYFRLTVLWLCTAVMCAVNRQRFITLFKQN